MKILKIGILLYFALLIATLAYFYIHTHNVDLAWNANGEGLIDCNKFQCKEINEIYVESYMYVNALPIVLTVVGFILGFLVRGEMKDD